MDWSDAELAETLRELDPLDAAGETRTNADAFVARVIERAQEHPSGSGRRRRWIAGGVAVVALAVSGTAAAFIFAKQPDDPVSVACHSIAAPSGGDTIVLSASGDPLELCAELWRTGRLPDSENTLPPGQAAPPLAACILNGVVQVFPGDSATVCAALGLEPASRESSAESDAVVALTDYLVLESEGRCFSMEQAAALAESALDRFRVDGWDLRERPAMRPDDVCVRVIVDATSKRIYLTPLGGE